MDTSFGPAILASLLPLGLELLQALSPAHNHTHAAIFKEFFDCLVSLAGTNKSDGHLQLVRAVGEWLPQCVKEVGTGRGSDEDTPTGPKGEETGKPREVGGDSSTTKGDSATTAASTNFVPVSSLLQYLSQLTTAVQLSCNSGEYVEKRGVAGEDDPLFDEDDGGEEAGLGGSGGGADEEDTAAEESVSGFTYNSSSRYENNTNFKLGKAKQCGYV